MARKLQIPAKPLTAKQIEALPMFQQRLKNHEIVGGLTYYREIEFLDFRMITATLDRLPPELLIQYDSLVNEAFPNPTYRFGDNLINFLKPSRLLLPTLAVSHDREYVLSGGTTRLLSTRGAGMGMNKLTRQAVVEIGNMVTSVDNRNQGLATEIVRARLTIAIDAIITLCSWAVDNGISLEHPSDKEVAPDLPFDNIEFLEALLGSDAIVRIFYENMTQMARVEKIMDKLGFDKSDASRTFAERLFAQTGTEGDPESTELSVYVTLNYPINGGIGTASEQQFILRGSNLEQRARELVLAIAATGGLGEVYQGNNEDGSWYYAVNSQDPYSVTLPNFRDEVFNLSTRTMELANTMVGQIEFDGDHIIIMPIKEYRIVARDLHRDLDLADD